jgi:hypothetical protein
MRPSGLTSSVVSSSEVDLLALTHGVDLDIELEGGGQTTSFHITRHKI